MPGGSGDRGIIEGSADDHDVVGETQPPLVVA